MVNKINNKVFEAEYILDKSELGVYKVLLFGWLLPPMRMGGIFKYGIPQ